MADPPPLPDPVTAAYRELAGIVLADAPLGATLSRIARSAGRLLPAVQDVSIALLRSGAPRTVAFAGDGAIASVLDERQYEAGYGPAMEAATSGRTIAIDDTTTADVHVDFCRLAARHGVGRILSIGMPGQHGVTGALNIYGHRDGPAFDARARRTAIGFAHDATAVVTNAALYSDAVEQAAQYRAAMASRAVIEQAKGMVMQIDRCSEEVAFAKLRHVSMVENRKLREVARSVVESGYRSGSGLPRA